MMFRLGDEIDWTGEPRRVNEHWHGVVMKQLPDDHYEVLWTRSDSVAHYVFARSDVPFQFNYRTHEPSDLLEACVDGGGGNHPRSNPWGNVYGIPGD